MASNMQKYLVIVTRNQLKKAEQELQQSLILNNEMQTNLAEIHKNASKEVEGDSEKIEKAQSFLQHLKDASSSLKDIITENTSKFLVQMIQKTEVKDAKVEENIQQKENKSLKKVINFRYKVYLKKKKKEKYDDQVKESKISGQKVTLKSTQDYYEVAEDEEGEQISQNDDVEFSDEENLKKEALKIKKKLDEFNEKQLKEKQFLSQLQYDEKTEGLIDKCKTLSQKLIDKTLYLKNLLNGIQQKEEHTINSEQLIRKTNINSILEMKIEDMDFITNIVEKGKIPTILKSEAKQEPLSNEKEDFMKEVDQRLQKNQKKQSKKTKEINNQEFEVEENDEQQLDDLQNEINEEDEIPSQKPKSKKKTKIKLD